MSRNKIDYERYEKKKDYIRSYPFSFEKINPIEAIGGKKINLYVHIPFCRGGCFFCPFNRFVYKNEQVERYLKSIEQEIKLISKKVNLKNLKIETIWIGGGTPSDLLAEQIDKLFLIIEKYFDYKDIEITFEGIADGESFNNEKIRILKKHNVNKISLGVQSLDEHVLRKILRRRYHSIDAKKTISLLKRKFDINTDFMYRLPGQDMKSFEKDIQEITSTNVDNITCFPFMLVKNTPIPKLIEKKMLPERPGKDIYFKMYKKLLSIMHSKGYYEYTPYHFAKKGKKIKYHVDRWGFPQKETLGIGAGAFSYFNETLYNNIHIVDEYIKCVKEKKIPVLMGKKTNDAERITRNLVLGTKLLKVKKKEFYDIIGLKMDDYFKEEIKLLIKKGLIKNSKKQIELTTLGKAFSNEVSKQFYTKENKGYCQPLGVDFKK